MSSIAYRTLWGVTEKLEKLIPMLRGKGYGGIETGLLFLSDEQKSQLIPLVTSNSLDLILTVLTFGASFGPSSVDEHFRSYSEQVQQALDFYPGVKKINVHSGCDAWNEEQEDAFYSRVVQFEQELKAKYPNLVLMHETHRSRVFHQPWRTLRILKKYAALRVNCDLSHWVVVCERLLEGPEFEEIWLLLKDRCVHVHARVATPQQIQIPDPRFQKYAPEVEAFTGYWMKLFDSQLRRLKSIAYSMDQSLIFLRTVLI